MKIIPKTSILLYIWSAMAVQAQSLSGHLAAHGGQTIELEGFEHYNTLTLAQTQLDSTGNFSLNYPKEYQGMGLLKTQDNNSLVVLLDGQALTIEGTHLTETDSLRFNESPNKTFFSYALAHSQQKNALRAWKYLQQLYGNDKHFKNQKGIKKAIAQEMQHLHKQERAQINRLPKDSYLRWFIPYRSFLQDMPTIIRTETERIPESIALFRTTDFNHPNWKTSGILEEFIEKHYFMLENSSGTLTEKQEKMNQSSRHILQHLHSNKLLINQVVEQLFSYLEKRSLHHAAEFLATQVLNDSQCEIAPKTAKKLEKYGSLKVGNQAPEIQLTANQKLSDYQQPLLLVFGKSDCPHCQKGALELLKHYDNWKTEKNVEVVYVSLDTDRQAYTQAYQHAPWPTFGDFKGWDSQAAKDYHIWGTPSYFLLDKDLTLLAHINSVAHANAWIQYQL